MQTFTPVERAEREREEEGGPAVPEYGRLASVKGRESSESQRSVHHKSRTERDAKLSLSFFLF